MRSILEAHKEHLEKVEREDSLYVGAEEVNALFDETALDDELARSPSVSDISKEASDQKLLDPNK